MQSNKKDSLKSFKKQIRDFAQEREWEQFHTPKNLSMALAVEVGELMEIFQWHTFNTKYSLSTDEYEQAREEVADIAIYLIRLCDVLDIDLDDAINVKMIKNRKKYPIRESKGNATKYNARKT